MRGCRQTWVQTGAQSTEGTDKKSSSGEERQGDLEDLFIYLKTFSTALLCIHRSVSTVLYVCETANKVIRSSVGSCACKQLESEADACFEELCLQS